MRNATFEKRIAPFRKGWAKEEVTRMVQGVSHPNNKIYPIYTQGSGKYAKYTDKTGEVKSILDGLGLDYHEGNDAPRGGKLGNFIELTAKGKRQLQPLRKELRDQEEANRKARQMARFGTTDEKEISRMMEEEVRESTQKAESFVRENKERIIEYWNRKKQAGEMNGNVPDSHQSAVRLSWRFNGEAGVPAKYVRDAIKKLL